MENENQDTGTITVETPVNNADIMAQLMDDYTPETEPNETETEPEVETDASTETDVQDDDLPEVTEENVDEVDEPDLTETTKANQAFKQMRENVQRYKQEAEANNEYAKVIKEIAEANGITPQELIKNYREKQAEKEADKAGIPVEVYKKLNSLEQEVTTLKTQPLIDNFNKQIDTLIQKYSLKDVDIQQFFAEANANGFDLTKVKDIEKVYSFLNVDKVIEKKEQKRLEQKEKIKSQAPITPTTSTKVEVNDDEEVENMLKKYGAWNGNK